jgi:energy-coupling factor transporter ATP-binding protein EcfA2
MCLYARYSEEEDMIKNITIQGFKSVYDVRLDLGRVNVFIGPNGSGKSNILEAVGVLSAAAKGRVDDESLRYRGVRPGLPALYKSSFVSDKTPPHIMLEARSDDEVDFRVALLNPLEEPKPAWSFKTEYLSVGDTELVSDGVRNKKNLNLESGLTALRMVDFSPGSPEYRTMTDLQGYAIYCPNTPTLRGLVPDPQSREPLGLAGGRLAEAFEELKTMVSNVGDDVLEMIDWASNVSVTRYVSNILSPSVPRTDKTIRFTDRFMRDSRNTLSASDASEGALYILFYGVLALSSKSPGFFAIDNFDQTLNPRMASHLTSKFCTWILSKASSQVLLTAHNPAVLDGLDLSNQNIRLFVVDRNNKGHTSVRRLEASPELIKLNEQYPLSRLWMMGHLGGVPDV